VDAVALAAALVVGAIHAHPATIVTTSAPAPVAIARLRRRGAPAAARAGDAGATTGCGDLPPHFGHFSRLPSYRTPHRPHRTATVIA
jgi:hypothetical protein